MEKGTVDYHKFKCTKYGYTGKRHLSGAMMAAIDMKIAMEGIP